jgi:hypothetical protein
VLLFRESSARLFANHRRGAAAAFLSAAAKDPKGKMQSWQTAGNGGKFVIFIVVNC